MRKSISGLYSVLLILPLIFLFFPTDSRASGKIDSSCSLNGKKLNGKVQVVSNFADFKVKVVNSFPDLKVKVVENFPDSCGEWKMVGNFPDFKIQLVDSFPDFTIQYVSSFPGVN